jgi:eukaryotic-like serine/threonine-protein kinase
MSDRPKLPESAQTATDGGGAEADGLGEGTQEDPASATAISGAAKGRLTLPAVPAGSEETTPIAEGMGSFTEWAQLGRFHVRGALGAGGMGVVLEADDPQLERRVAIKVLHVGDGSHATVRRGRLLREARAAARLSHPNIITIHDVGMLADGHPFIAMELVEGETLAQWQAKPRPWREVVAIYLQAARGLAAAHQAGLVHRDFKPDNVLLGRHGAVRVSDFGIAAVAETAETATERSASASASASVPALSTGDLGEVLTADGEILGTPAFMAPEQRTSAAVDERADQYAFCVALHHALTGELPFGNDPEQRARRAAAGQLITPKVRRGPRALFALIERGLAPQPADRFPSMHEVIAGLEAALDQRRRRLVLAGVAALAALAALWLVLRPSASECGGGDEALALTWGAAQRQAVFAAFGKSGLPGADGVAARTTLAIERWGKEWSGAYLDACRATRVHRSADEATLARRMACLTSAREVLGGIVTAFAAADRELAGKSPEIILGLPRVAECAAPPPAATPPAAERAALRRQLDAADAAITIGNIEPAIAAIEEVLAAARAAADRELEAIALLRLGRLQRRRGDTTLAVATLFDAAVAAEALRRDDLAAEAWAEWLFARRGKDVDPSILADGERRGGEALARAGNPPYLRALLLNNRGAVQFSSGNYDAADKLYREALELRERLFGPRDPRVADVLDNIGTNLDRWARKTEGDEGRRLATDAFAIGQRALAIREETLGPDHPSVARSLQNLSLMMDQHGHRNAARPLLARALRIKETALGPDHVELTTTLNYLADLEEQDGHLEEALAGYRRSTALIERSFGKDAAQVGFPMTAVAEILDALGRPAEAAPLFRRLTAIRTKPAEQRRAAVRAILSEVAAGAELGPARQELTELLAAEREELPADDPRRAPSLLSAARLDIAARELEQAETRISQAAALWGDAPPSPAAGAELAVARAELERARGKLSASRTFAQEAITACAARACETAGLELVRRAERVLQR